MSKANPIARRVRVEANIYSRRDARGRTIHEVGFRDSTGRQRWRTVQGGITAARTVRNDILARKGKGERVQPNPKLRFGDAADGWLAGQVGDLRPATQATYGNAIETHLRPRWGRRRLDAITVEDVALLVRELRVDSKAEWTIAGVLTAANRVFKYAKRRMNWHGENPVMELEKVERPAVSAAARRPIFHGDELAQTLRAAREPYKTLFALGSVTGARMSECLGLVWADLALGDLDAADVRFEQQVDRRGQRQRLKTEESRRTVEIPRQLAAMLVAHKLRSTDTGPSAFVFATRSGRPIQQRSVGVALRRAQTDAVDQKGPSDVSGASRVRPGRSACSSSTRRATELPFLQAHRRQRGDRRGGVRGRNLVAARTQEQHHHARRLHPGGQERRAHCPPQGSHGGALRSRPGRRWAWS
jgi:integrase